MPYYSIVDASGSAGQSNFGFSFPYLNRNHIHVYINDVETVAFTFSNASTVTLDTPLVDPSTVRVRRITPIDLPVIDYSNGSVLGETDMDSAALQVLYSQQELADAAVDTLTLTLNDGLKWDALTHQIINVGNPTAAQDAATKAYVDAQYAASPGGHSIYSHSDVDPASDNTAGDLLVADNSVPSLLKQFPIGTNLDILEVDTSTTQKLRWRSLASKLFQMLTTKGDLMVSTGATVQRKAVGANDAVLTADSAQADGLAWVAPTALSTPSVARSVNLRGSKATATQFAFTADVVILTNSSGLGVRRTSASATNDISTVGPAANGRDQAGAFSASSWIHFYWIWNGTTLATVSSATGPATGPTLPNGYTHWCYITTLPVNGSTQFLADLVMGNTVFRDPHGTVQLTSLTTATETAASSANVLPSIALTAQFDARLYANDAAVASGDNVTFAFRAVSGGGTGWSLANPMVAQPFVNTFNTWMVYHFTAPYLATYYVALADSGTITTRNLDISVVSYTVPNNS